MFSFFNNSNNDSELPSTEQRYHIDSDSEDENIPLGETRAGGVAYSASLSKRDGKFFKRRKSTTLTKQPSVVPVVPRRQTSRPSSMRSSVGGMSSSQQLQQTAASAPPAEEVRRSYFSNIFKSFKSADEVYTSSAQEPAVSVPPPLLYRTDSVTSSSILGNYMAHPDSNKKRVNINENVAYFSRPEASVTEPRPTFGFRDLFRSNSGRSKEPTAVYSVQGKRQSASGDSIAGEVDRLYKMAIGAPAISSNFSKDSNEEFSNKEKFLSKLNGGADSAYLYPDGQVESYGRPTIAGLVLFLLGFVFIPSWWVGSVVPTQPLAPVELNFKALNRGMSLLSTLYLALIAGLLIYEKKSYGTISI